MNLLLLSPYHSGSHQSWAEGLAAHSQHSVQLMTLPGRFWKWRMHGAAVTFAQRISTEKPDCDLILADSMLDLSSFLAIARQETQAVPVAVYMHENQLTYPLPSDPTTGAMRRNHNERDQHYVFINYSSMLAADAVYFNSQFHLDSWFEALPRYLKHYPDFRNMETVSQLKAKSSVLPVGIGRPAPQNDKVKLSGRVPLVLWNQRWEYDKNPEAFFSALGAAQARGIGFQLAICGENFSRKPSVFEEAKQQFSAELIHFGYADKETYQTLLTKSDIVVSTAIHEFFGISIIEAILHGAFPILPRRLSYPELIPSQAHGDIFYDDDAQLVDMLCNALLNVDAFSDVQREVRVSAEKFTWPRLIVRYDQEFSKLVA